MSSTKRLDILKGSLAKKEAEFDWRLDAHFADVASANGQPLNDKRNGAATVGRWDRQDDALRSLKQGIGVTKAAIEREQQTIDHVASVGVPGPLKALVEAGTLIQWRKHPHTYFVAGVDKARIVWLPDRQTVAHKHTATLGAEQRKVFAGVYNPLLAACEAAKSIRGEQQ